MFGFLSRLKEPSSQAGLGVVAAAAVQLGALAVFVPEKAGN